jgi:aspartate kinase
MVSNPGVAADMFEALASENININMISTSEIKISCVVEENEALRAVRAIHARMFDKQSLGGIGCQQEAEPERSPVST